MREANRDMYRKREINKYRPGLLHVWVAIMLMAIVTACSSSSEKKRTGGEIKIELIADKDINPNSNGHPAPLTIFIYDVKDKDIFSNADFFEIIDGGSKSLQAAASEVYEAILQPGETRSIYIQPTNDTRTLGFVGAYRNLNDAGWLVTWDLQEKKKSWWRKIFSHDALKLTAHFQKTTVIVKKSK